MRVARDKSFRMSYFCERDHEIVVRIDGPLSGLGARIVDFVGEDFQVGNELLGFVALSQRRNLGRARTSSSSAKSRGDTTGCHRPPIAAWRSLPHTPLGVMAAATHTFVSATALGAGKLRATAGPAGAACCPNLFDGESHGLVVAEIASDRDALHQGQKVCSRSIETSAAEVLAQSILHHLALTLLACCSENLGRGQQVRVEVDGRLPTGHGAIIASYRQNGTCVRWRPLHLPGPRFSCWGRRRVRARIGTGWERLCVVWLRCCRR